MLFDIEVYQRVPSIGLSVQALLASSISATDDHSCMHQGQPQMMGQCKGLCPELMFILGPERILFHFSWLQRKTTIGCPGLLGL